MIPVVCGFFDFGIDSGVVGGPREIENGYHMRERMDEETLKIVKKRGEHIYVYPLLLPHEASVLVMDEVNVANK